MTQSSGYFQSYDNTERPGKVNGIDISHWQTSGSINFASAYSAGDRFAIFKVGGNYVSYFTARYIRCTVNGSYTNTSSIFNEIKVYNSAGTEVAGGKTVTGSEGTPQSGSYSDFTDGNTSTYVIVGDNTQWVQVDLGSSVSIWYIKLWHYSGRIFKDNKIEYSTDGLAWTTLFDSASAGEYLETSDGMCILKYGGVSKDSVNFTSAHVASARAAGLKVATYFFFCPNYYSTTSGRWLTTTADASSNASSLVGWITDTLGTGDYGDCFAFLDWENPYGGIYPATDCSGGYDYVKTFVDTYRTLTNGRQCGMYTAYYTIDTMTADNALMMSKSSAETIGSVCPLWLSQVIDSTSAYPRYGFEAWGQFPNNLWTMWQFSYVNNSGAAHGMLAGDLDLDLLEGAIETIMPPSSVSFSGVGAASTITLTWTTGEVDVRGYVYYGSGITTATVTTGVGSATITGLSPNTSYPITMYSYDTWENGTSISASVSTTAASLGYGTLLCFRAV